MPFLITANHDMTAHITMCKCAPPQSSCQESFSGWCRCLLAFCRWQALVIIHPIAYCKVCVVYKNAHLECKQEGNINILVGGINQLVTKGFSLYPTILEQVEYNFK